MSAKDNRPSVVLDSNSENTNTRAVRVIPLLKDVDAASNRYQQLIEAHNAEILVTGRIASIVYIATNPSHIKIYLEDCVPRILG